MGSDMRVLAICVPSLEIQEADECTSILSHMKGFVGVTYINGDLFLHIPVGGKVAAVKRWATELLGVHLGKRLTVRETILGIPTWGCFGIQGVNYTSMTGMRNLFASMGRRPTQVMDSGCLLHKEADDFLITFVILPGSRKSLELDQGMISRVKGTDLSNIVRVGVTVVWDQVFWNDNDIHLSLRYTNPESPLLAEAPEVTNDPRFYDIPDE